MESPTTSDITRILAACEGDPEALARLTPLVYGELHRLAQVYLAGERPESIGPYRILRHSEDPRGHHPGHAAIHEPGASLPRWARYRHAERRVFSGRSAV